MQQISKFFQKNYQQLLAIFGFLALLGVVAIAILQSLRFISSLPGFNFDPFLLGGLVFVGYLFSSAITNQTKLLEKQLTLIEKISQSTSIAQNSSAPIKGKNVSSKSKN
jgi:hypothetical protein